MTIILKSTSVRQWHYIPTEENPGDLASRPQTLQSLSQSCWFRGPPFLWSEQLTFFCLQSNDQDLPELLEESQSLKAVTNMGTQSPFTTLCNKISTWRKLLCIIEHVLAFILKLRQRITAKKKNLQASTTNQTTALIRIAQMECFPYFFSQGSTTKAPKGLEF